MIFIPHNFRILEFTEKWNLSVEDASDVYQLYRQAWWADTRTLERTEKVLEGSSMSLGLYDGPKLIAFARIVTDYICKGTIYDVVVDSEYRNRKIGKLLMDTLVDHERLLGVEHLELYCLPEMAPFYQKLGYHELIPEVMLLRLKK